MSEDEKNMAIATFRFGIISEFVTGMRLDYGDKEKLIAEKISRHYQIPESSQTRISKSTIKSWILNYRSAGNKITGLMPRKRKDNGQFKSLDPNLQMAIHQRLDRMRRSQKWTGGASGARLATQVRTSFEAER